MEKQYGPGFAAEQKAVEDERMEALAVKDPEALAGEITAAATETVEEVIAQAEQDPSSFSARQAAIRAETHDAMRTLMNQLNEITDGAYEEDADYERTPETTEIEREIERANMSSEIQRTRLWIQQETEFMSSLDFNDEWLESVDSEKVDRYRESKEAYKKSIEERIQLHEQFLEVCQKALEQLDESDNPSEMVSTTFQDGWDVEKYTDSSSAMNAAAEQYFNAAKQAGEDGINSIRHERSQYIHNDMERLQESFYQDQLDDEFLEEIRSKYGGTTKHPNVVADIERRMAQSKAEQARMREYILEHIEVMYTGKVSEQADVEEVDPRTDPRLEVIAIETAMQLNSIERMLGEDTMKLFSAAFNERYSVGSGEVIPLEDLLLGATQLRKMANEMRSVLHDDYQSSTRQRELAQAMGMIDSQGNENQEGITRLFDRAEKFGSIFSDRQTEEEFIHQENNS
jgi:hypothetical protein